MLFYDRPVTIPADRAWPVGGVTKRSLDILAASALIALLFPLMGCVAMLVLSTDRGPIFYAHERVGFKGRLFRCLKFRSMRVNSAVILEQYLAGNSSARLEWERDQKLRSDPRVTTVGRFVRKWSLDELPQLFNVLAGDMSIVGPRPVTERELSRYRSNAEFYLSSRPGITGLWQVSGRNNLSYDTRVALDALYVKSWSLLLDGKLLLKTFGVVLGGEKSGSF
ncbi:MAG TPA: sugar transferase [Devosiaceae bacterium]|nr:sugar transferase [Devosiaceae bacterium]